MKKAARSNAQIMDCLQFGFLFFVDYGSIKGRYILLDFCNHNGMIHLRTICFCPLSPQLILHLALVLFV